ncbi:MAG: phosphatase PAP2 family protein [Candidatus Saccharimonas sp.]
MKKLKKSEEHQVKLTASVIAAFTLFALCVMGFVNIAHEVIERETSPIDTGILKAVHRLESHFLDSFIPVATDIGGVVGVSVLTVLALALFVYKKEYIRAIGVFVSVAGASLLNVLLKSVFERARPDLWERLVNESSYSFPSGHAMASAALGIAVVVALWNSRWRWWSFSAAALYIVFVGFSRMYLGVHYPTDIIAGWCVSGAWVLAVALLIRSKLGHRALKKLS